MRLFRRTFLCLIVGVTAFGAFCLAHSREPDVGD